jgi:hypothetical protein
MQYAICKLELLTEKLSSLGAHAVCARRTEWRGVHVVEALSGTAEGGSYEQEEAVVEENEVMEREDERGAAKRPGLNELDVPEWAELALDKVEWMEGATATAAHRRSL